MPVATDPVTIEPVRHDPDIISAAYDLRELKRSILFEVMDGTGDTKLIWDASQRDEVENAKQTYERLTRKGYRAFHVTGKNGDKGEIMSGFDPKAERVILVPPMQGG